MNRLRSVVGGPDVNGHGASPSRARRHRRPGRPGWLAMAAIGGTLGLVTTACSGGGGTASGPNGGPAATKTAAAAALSIAPANGSTSVNPARGITVTAAQGKISDVTVTTSGDPVSGTLNAAGTAWRSTNPTLDVSQRYTVTARAAGTSGQTFTRTSTFRTLTPSQTFRTQILHG